MGIQGSLIFRLSNISADILVKQFDKRRKKVILGLMRVTLKDGMFADLSEKIACMELSCD